MANGSRRKKQIRAHMAETGLSYTQAMRDLERLEAEQKADDAVPIAEEV